MESARLLIFLSWSELVKEDRGGQVETPSDKPGRVGVWFCASRAQPEIEAAGPGALGAESHSGLAFPALRPSLPHFGQN